MALSETCLVYLEGTPFPIVAWHDPLEFERMVMKARNDMAGVPMSDQQFMAFHTSGEDEHRMGYLDPFKVSGILQA